MAGRYVLMLVCTDRGQHPVTMLGDLTGSGPVIRANGGNAWSESQRRQVAESLWLDEFAPPEWRVHMRCPRCRRHVQWRNDTATDVMQRLESVGVSRVDISALPAF